MLGLIAVKLFSRTDRFISNKFLNKDIITLITMDLTVHFEKAIAENSDFQEALDIARLNSLEGKIWLVGGAVFRNIVYSLYNRCRQDAFDFDFILENPVAFNKIEAPRGWDLVKTHFGDPRFAKGEGQVDMFSLYNAVDPVDYPTIDGMTVDEKLESYFRRVPLTIQAIAYDVAEGKVIGDKGIGAILAEEIKINNPQECLNFCRARKISVRHFIQTKAASLGFTPIFYKFSDDNKAETIAFYDRYVNEYQIRPDNYLSFILDNLSEEIRSFINALHGRRVLDLGCGPGRDSIYFRQQGLIPVCVDLSEKMVEACRNEGLEAYQKDMEDLDFEESSFDGVWAYASLVHIPKARVHNAVARVSELLRPDGLCFVGMVEGEDERLYESPTKPGKRRFFSLYQDAEFQEILLQHFKIISSKRFEANRRKYLNYLCKKV